MRGPESPRRLTIKAKNLMSSPNRLSAGSRNFLSPAKDIKVTAILEEDSQSRLQTKYSARRQKENKTGESNIEVTRPSQLVLQDDSKDKSGKDNLSIPKPRTAKSHGCSGKHRSRNFQEAMAKLEAGVTVKKHHHHQGNMIKPCTA